MMPDITMCRGEVMGGARVCPRRNRCYRFTAPPSRRQSYFSVLPAKADDTCEYFTDDTKEGG